MNGGAAKARDAAWQVFAGVAVAAVLVMVLAFFMLRFLITQGAAAEGWATFGDVYGAVVGSFFAAMAFAGVILTVHLQRVEMRAAREEMRRAAEAQEQSEKALKAQVDVAQIAASLSATQAIFEYYEDLVKRLARKPGMADFHLRSIFAQYRYRVPDARFDREIMDKNSSSLTVEQKYDHFVQALVEARERSVHELHALRDTLRHRAQEASMTVTVVSDAEQVK